jgi:carbon-monoxide dehydrogenase small subunit
VLVDGVPVLSCLALASIAKAARSKQWKGWRTAKLHPLQAAFADLGGAQCGYCRASDDGKGSARKIESRPREDQGSRNLCRCGYQQIESMGKALE